MRKVIITQEPVPFKNCSGLLSILLVSKLDESRKEELNLLHRHENLLDYTLEPAPWKRVNEKQFCATFTWIKSKEPEIVDAEFRHLPEHDIATLDAMAKLIFVQKGFVNNDLRILGTRLMLKAIQLI